MLLVLVFAPVSSSLHKSNIFQFQFDWDAVDACYPINKIGTI